MCYYVYTQITLTTLIINHPNILFAWLIVRCQFGGTLHGLYLHRIQKNFFIKIMPFHRPFLLLCFLLSFHFSYSVLCHSIYMALFVVCACVCSLFHGLIFHSVAAHLSFSFGCINVEAICQKRPKRLKTYVSK